jgi:hypothetical protein
MAKQPSLRSSANDLGRVAQSAERVREQHETMVRNHSPAATSLEDRLVPRLTVIERMSVADHPQPPLRRGSHDLSRYPVIERRTGNRIIGSGHEPGARWLRVR